MSAGPRCGDCRHFRNDPVYLEDAIKGLSALSSAWASVRAEDGICLLHDRYLSSEASCDRFQHANSTQAATPP